MKNILFLTALLVGGIVNAQIYVGELQENEDSDSIPVVTGGGMMSGYIPKSDLLRLEKVLEASNDANGQTITNLGEPINITDAATRGFILDLLVPIDQDITDLQNNKAGFNDAVTIGANSNSESMSNNSIDLNNTNGVNVFYSAGAENKPYSTNSVIQNFEHSGGFKQQLSYRFDNSPLRYRGYNNSSGTWTDWRSVWDDNTLPDPATETYVAGELSNYIPLSQKGANNGVATLDSNGKLPSEQVPPIAITETFVVNSESGMLGLDATIGDVAVRDDVEESYILQSEPASSLSNWVLLKSPTDESVSSVNSLTGNIQLDPSFTNGQLSITNSSSVNLDSRYYTEGETDGLLNNIISDADDLENIVNGNVTDIGNLIDDYVSKSETNLGKTVATGSIVPETAQDWADLPSGYIGFIHPDGEGLPSNDYFFFNKRTTTGSGYWSGSLVRFGGQNEYYISNRTLNDELPTWVRIPNLSETENLANSAETNANNYTEDQLVPINQDITDLQSDKANDNDVLHKTGNETKTGELILENSGFGDQLTISRTGGTENSIIKFKSDHTEATNDYYLGFATNQGYFGLLNEVTGINAAPFRVEVETGDIRGNSLELPSGMAITESEAVTLGANSNSGVLPNSSSDLNSVAGNNVFYSTAPSGTGNQPNNTNSVIQTFEHSSGYKQQIASRFDTNVPFLAFRGFDYGSAQEWSEWYEAWGTNNLPNPATEDYVDTAEQNANDYTDTKISESAGVGINWNDTDDKLDLGELVPFGGLTLRQIEGGGEADLIGLGDFANDGKFIGVGENGLQAYAFDLVTEEGNTFGLSEQAFVVDVKNSSTLQMTESSTSIMSESNTSGDDRQSRINLSNSGVTLQYSDNDPITTTTRSTVTLRENYVDIATDTLNLSNLGSRVKVRAAQGLELVSSGSTNGESSIILSSPDGTKFRIEVDNNGDLITTEL